jgi:CheY-like chemotaxis protein
MSEPALGSGQMRYLLVVESDWKERFTLSMLLQRFGYTVASTSSAGEAVEFLCVAPPVAVFAETGEVGVELSVRLKADRRFGDVPLVLVTGRPDPGVEERLRQGEFAGVLTTPVDPDEVYRVVQKVIEKGTRENIRIPTALPAELQDGHGTTEGFITVLSQYGMFFRTLDPRPENERAAVSFQLGEGTVKAMAQVLYVVSFEEGPFSEPGMGMKFVDIAPKDSAMIRFFIYEEVGTGIIHPGRGAEAGWA